MVKFRDVLWRWGAGELWMMEAGELLGTSKRQFLQYRDRFEEDGEEWPRDRRLGKPSPKRAGGGEGSHAGARAGGWNIKHFNEQLPHDHGFGWATAG
jgi:hypothetical protein